MNTGKTDGAGTPGQSGRSMPAETPLSKRIKRHVIGRTREFFIAVSPGFETICLKELQAPPLSIDTGAVLPGGIVFQGRLHDCWLANLHLRMANRILMRIGVFNAATFPRLQKRLSDIPWELYLRPDGAPLVHVTTARSRLYHTDAIAERVLKSIENRLEKMRPEEDHELPAVALQRIFVRAAADQFTVSIDSSGELLYKRGIKTRGGKAPIRETIAAAALLLAGYTGGEPLVDPMCGSGTFSIEGAMMAGGIPPGAFRTFAFMGWPSFTDRKWDYLKRTSDNRKTAPGAAQIFASDIDPDICLSLRKNLEETGLSPMIDVSCRDFFAFSPGELTAQQGLVAINPPYGRRLGTRRQSRALFRSVCAHLKKTYSGWKVVLVAPEPEWTCDIPFPVSRRPFTHGGLRPTLLTGKIP
jgi:putative N6-adenine-specific DNA methylase